MHGMLKFAALAMAIGALAGCGHTRGERALTGGAIGAAAGGIIGGDVTGAVVGGAVGAAGGAATAPDHRHHPYSD